MMNQVNIKRLREIAEVEFSDIVKEAMISDVNELRIMLKEGSFIDIWFSLKLVERYSYHWERRAIDGTVYRHDNAPHRRWNRVTIFPKHFHDGSETNVMASHLSEQPEKAIREFLIFVQALIDVPA